MGEVLSPGHRWRATIEPRPLPALLDEAVKSYADRPCLSFRGKQYSYREVGRLVDRAAKGLQSLGVRKGIKVGLMLPNCPYAVICFYAVLKAGGTVVNINPLYAAPGDREADRRFRLPHARDASTSRALREGRGLGGRRGRLEKLVVCRMSGALRFVEKMVFDLFKGRDVAAISRTNSHVPFERLIDNDGASSRSAIDPSRDVAVLQYTGGTTGSPKGAQLTHANLYINTAQLAAVGAGGAAAAWRSRLAVLPLFHCLRHDGGHEPEPVDRRRDHPAAEVPARRGPRDHRPREADHLHRRADDVSRR